VNDTLDSAAGEPFLALAQSEPLLALYQQALGHDLPNKLVALQGFAKLIDQEAKDRLDEDSRYCLERLSIVARQMHGQLAALADVGRTLRRGGPVSALALQDVWRELTAEVTCKYPKRPITFEAVHELPTVRLPQRTARRALLELVLMAIRRVPTGVPLRLTLQAVQDAEGHVSVSLTSDGPTPSVSEQEMAFEPTLEATEGPILGPFLARLIVEGWGGSLRMLGLSEGGCRLVMELPQSVAPIGTGK
jgi:signal transduction histidine kinase